MNYDEWKTQTPPEAPENECGFCGEPCHKEFCNKECEKAYLND